MRYLIITDIHANLEAFEAVLGVAGEWDATLCLGDIVGYGPNPNECVARLRQLPNLATVIGNHDVAALGEMDLNAFNPLARAAAEWTRDVMSSETEQFLRNLGQVEEVGSVTLVHGSPRDPVWEYLDRLSQAPENFARFTTKLCFVGHTHVPRVFTQQTETKETDVFVPEPEQSLDLTQSARLIVNPGSVGQPRDGDPRAAYATYDSQADTFEFHRVEYPIQQTQKKMRADGLPEPLAERLAFGF